MCFAVFVQLQRLENSSVHGFVQLQKLENSSVYGFVQLQKLENSSVHGFVQLQRLENSSAHGFVQLQKLENDSICGFVHVQISRKNYFPTKHYCYLYSKKWKYKTIPCSKTAFWWRNILKLLYKIIHFYRNIQCKFAFSENNM